MRQALFPANQIRYFADQGDPVCVQGVISSPVERRKDSQVFIMAADSVWLNYQVHAATGKVRVRFWEDKPELKYGDRVLVKGRLAEPTGARNPGEFNYRAFLQARGIYAVLAANAARNVLILEREQGEWLLQHVVYPVRSYILHFIKQTLDGQHAALLQGLLVGARENIDYELRTSFANVGVIHVLAVSGLHVGFILFGLFYLLNLVRIPEPWRSFLVIIGLAFYALLTGLHAPVVRASIMAAVILLGTLVQRPTDIINSLAIAAFIILVANPLELFAAGFQLSFVAVLGIVLIYQRLRSRFLARFLDWREKGSEVKVYLVSLFFVSLAAQLATLPLTAYYFGRIPIVSFVANLFVVPLVAVIVGLGYISVIVSFLYWPIAAVYANANWLSLTGLVALVTQADRLPFSHAEIARPSTGLILLYYTFLLLFVVWQQARARKRVIILLLILLNFLTWQSIVKSEQGVHITFFDVGNGDAALFEFPDGRTLLVDAGERNEQFDCGERIIAPYLKRKGIRAINTLLITHPHADHIGGAPYLMQHFRIGRIVQSPVRAELALLTAVDSLAAARDIPIRNVLAGDTLAGYPATVIMVLNPNRRFVGQAERDLSRLNDCSVVVKLTYGENDFLLTGDAESESEQAMLAFGDLLRSDLIKVGHHGSSTSSTAQFRENVRPHYAVISVGRYNRHGLPSEQVVRSWRQQGAEILRTDRSGAAVFFADGVKIRKVAY